MKRPGHQVDRRGGVDAERLNHRRGLGLGLFRIGEIEPAVIVEHARRQRDHAGKAGHGRNVEPLVSDIVEPPVMGIAARHQFGAGGHQR